MKTTYVLLYIFNEDNSKMVGLIKKRGLDFLINKRTVPGGKREDGESIYEASTREAKEECDLDINNWVLFDSTEAEHYSYYKLYSLGNDISKAKQMEAEPVFIMDVKQEVQNCKDNPQLYTPDFGEHMQKLSTILLRN